MARVGVQMMIFKKQIEEIGVYEVLRKIKEIGYSCVEVSQVEMSSENVAGIRKAMDDFDIEVAALSAAVELQGVGGESLKTHFDKIVSDCKTLDCNYLRIGVMPFAYMVSKEQALVFAQMCDEYAERLEEHGIKLYYHNHHMEFVKYDDKYLLDILREESSKLGFELDVYWIQRGGENPVNFIEKYKGKVELLHLKDYKIAKPDFSECEADNMWAAFDKITQFAEIYEGSLDFDAIIETGLKSGVEYMIIEQDDTYGRDPYVCLAKSRENIEQHGYGKMF